MEAPLRRAGVILALVLVGLTVAVWWFVSLSAGLAAAAVFAFVAACVAVVPGLLVALDTRGRELNAEERATAVAAARSAVVQGVVGLLAIGGIGVAWQQLQSDREQFTSDRQQLSDQLQVTRQGQVAERFTRAVDQLASKDLEQQLGGIYGLERIAEESDSNRLQVFEVLTAYVRQHSHEKTNTAEDSEADDLWTRAPNVQAAITVLGRRTVKTGDPRLNLKGVDLHQADLQGAQLQNANLWGARLQGANLWRAQLQGATLQNTHLESAYMVEAQLRGANLGAARLDKAELGSADLQTARFFNTSMNEANLDGAKLQGARLTDTKLRGAYLGGVQLETAVLQAVDLFKADLQDAQLQKARLRRVNLSEANLQGAQLQGARLILVNFVKANLSTAQLQGAMCDTATRWPDGFDRAKAGVELGKTPSITIRP